MKKLFTYIVSIFITFVSVDSAKAFFWVYPIPGYPTPDFVDQASAIVKSGAAAGQSAQVAIKFGVDTENNLKNAAMSVYQGELGTLVQNSATNVGQKTIEDCSYKCKKYKVTSSDDVYTLTKILFLQYPDQGVVAEKTYDSYRDAFYKDNLMEIFAAANELQVKMEGDIKALVDSSIECITSDGQKCNIPNAEGNTDSLFVEGKAYEAINNLFEVLLKVTTLKAQLAAIQAIQSIQPAPYVSGVEDQVADTSDDEESEEDETSESSSEEEIALLPESCNDFTTRIRHIERLAFAQVKQSTETRSNINSLSKAESSEISKELAKKQVDGFVSFVTPPESPIAHIYVEHEDQIAEMDKITDVSAVVDKAVSIHNTIYNLDSYKDAAESLKEAKDQHQRALESLKKVDTCARQYIGRHFKNPDEVWGASASNITNHDARTGISGWAYNAYETAKAAEVNVEDEDSAKEAVSSSDIVIPDIDIDENSVASSGDIEKDNQIGQDLIAAKVSGPGKGKEEQAVAENRKTHMLLWQIGAEASKMLASSPKSWGEPVSQRAFPIWQDVKSYYDAYLEQKYANIKSYLNMFDIVDVLAVVSEKLRGNEQDASDSLYQKELKDINEKMEAQYAELDEEAKAGIQKQQVGLIKLQQQRQELVAKLNKASDDMQNASTEVEAIRSKTQDEAGQSMRDKVSAKTKFPTFWGEEVSQEAEIGKIASAEEDSKKLSANTAENKKRLGFEAAQKNFSVKRELVSELENELKILDEKIAEEKMLMQESGGSDSESYASKKSEIAEKMIGEEVTEGLKNKYAQKVDANLRSILLEITEDDEILSSMILSELKNSALKGLAKLKDVVAEEISEAKRKLKAMGDDLYEPSNHNKVVKIHNQMLENIKNKAVIRIAEIDGLPSISSVYLLGKLLKTDISVEEEDYFVGSTPKERDLYAPKAIFASKLPPLREVFHFDATDFNNVTPFSKKKKSQKAIVIDNFLNVGGEIPEVWKYMLRQHAFVETDINLHDVLNIGCETIAHYRGGVMPCRIKNSQMILDVNNDGELIMAPVSGSYNECDLLEFKENKLRHTRRKTKNNKNVYLDVSIVSDLPNKNCKYSELGTLLDVWEMDFIPGTWGTNIILERIKRKSQQDPIKFRSKVYDAYYAVLEELNSDGKGFNKEKEGFLGQVEKLSLDRNQIGEFLFFAENEKNMRQQMIETEKKYKEMVEELFNKLRDFGYEPSSDLDFSKEEDYNLVRKQLDNAKKETLQDAINQLSSIQVKGYEAVEERVKAQQGIIDALQFDKDENTIISEGLDEGKDYETSVKSSKANRSAVDKYKKTVEDNTKEYKRAEAPYCAIY